MSVLFSAKGKQKEVLQKLKSLYLQNLGKTDLEEEISIEIKGKSFENKQSLQGDEGEEWLKTELTKLLDTID